MKTVQDLSKEELEKRVLELEDQGRALCLKMSKEMMRSHSYRSYMEIAQSVIKWASQTRYGLSDSEYPANAVQDCETIQKFLVEHVDKPDESMTTPALIKSLALLVVQLAKETPYEDLEKSLDHEVLLYTTRVTDTHSEGAKMLGMNRTTYLARIRTAGLWNPSSISV